MPTVTITSDQTIKELHIVFDGNGAADVKVNQTPDPVRTPMLSSEPHRPLSQEVDEHEIDLEDFDKYPMHGEKSQLEMQKDNRPTVGEAFTDPSELGVITSKVKAIQPIKVDEVENRPPRIDTGMGEEL